MILKKNREIVTWWFDEIFFLLLQRKEAIGDDDTLPEDITKNVKEITKEKCDGLTVFQLKKVRSLIDEAMAANNQVLEDQAKLRDDTLREIGNWLHPSVPVSNDEVSNTDDAVV